MKSFVLIFIALLSLLFGGDRARNTCDKDIHYTGTVIQYSDEDDANQKADFNDVAILPASTATFTRCGSSFSPSFRPTNSGRRVQSSIKSTFRVIRSGKVFDRSNFHTFLTTILQFQSGIRSNNRYIYAICHLLI